MTYPEFKRLAFEYSTGKHGMKKGARVIVARELKELEWIWRKSEYEFLAIVKK